MKVVIDVNLDETEGRPTHDDLATTLRKVLETLDFVGNAPLTPGKGLTMSDDPGDPSVVPFATFYALKDPR